MKSIVIIAWLIWPTQNKLIFENIRPDLVIIVNRVTKLLEDYQEANRIVS